MIPPRTEYAQKNPPFFPFCGWARLWAPDATKPPPISPDTAAARVTAKINTDDVQTNNTCGTHITHA